MALTLSDRGQGRAYSVNFDDEADWSVGEKPRNHWTDYIVGTYTILIREGFDVPLADISVQSTIPIGGGVSSSAAFCVCLIRGLNALADLQLMPNVSLCWRKLSKTISLVCHVGLWIKWHRQLVQWASPCCSILVTIARLNMP